MDLYVRPASLDRRFLLAPGGHRSISRPLSSPSSSIGRAAREESVAKKSSRTAERKSSLYQTLVMATGVDDISWRCCLLRILFLSAPRANALPCLAAAE